MSTDLILQGELNAALVAELASLAGASSERETASGWRLMSVVDTPAVRSAIDARCLAARIDHGFMPANATLADYRLLVMDMDSTLITIECIDEIADMMGIKAQVAAITEATMRGEIPNFEESLRRRVALLAGLDERALARVYDERLRLSPGAETMLASVRAAGLKTLLVSGGFTFFTERIKQRVGLDFAHSNTLEIRDGKLTGAVIGPVVDSQRKAQLLAQTCAALGVGNERAIAMGDGANDVPMMQVAGMSVAYHAKPVVRAQTSHAIDFGGLDVLTGWFAA